MSASPSGVSNGQTPTPKGGAPPGFVRRRVVADPLRPRKPVRKPGSQPPRNPTSRPQNGLSASRPPNVGTPNGLPPTRAPNPNAPNAVPAQGNPQLSINGPRRVGWTNQPTGPYQDYPLITTKRSLREGLRYHVARFMAKRNVDPSDPEEFTRPVVLQRRDPRQQVPGRKEEEEPVEDVLDSKEREKQEILKAEKERQRAEDMAQIAPSAQTSAARKKFKGARNEKTSKVAKVDLTEEQQKASNIRYEETRPWHLEDADNKNTWVGNYEAALSKVNAMFVIDGHCFRMVPVEKWYKFTAKANFKTFTIEEAEEQLKKKIKESRWVMKTDEQKQAEQDAKDYYRMTSMFTVKGESGTFKSAAKNQKDDIDDLDFEALFDDDDEQPGLEADDNDSEKEAQAKIKKEQLGSNLFGDGDEREVDREMAELKREKELLKKQGKGTKKALKWRERNFNYASDSEDHPYSSRSEDDTSDEEKQEEIDKRKDEEYKAKLKAKAEAGRIDSKLPSGASSKGNTTPSGRPKHIDPLRKANKLKRPGSPNLSESSGNESSRKKQKKTAGTSTPAGSRASPAPTSQPVPGQVPRRSSIVRLNVNPSRLSEINSTSPNASAMSDGEATAGEMSDNGRKKKIKLRIGTSPGGSRAASPAPGRSGSAAGSRAGSPQVTDAVRPPPALGPITAAEIRAAMPPGGITLSELLKIFGRRVGDAAQGKMDKKQFIVLVKQNTRMDTNKRLYAK